MRILFGLLLLVGSLPAQAAIYRIVDADGRTTFTDTWRPGAVKVADDIAASPVPPTAASKRDAGAKPARSRPANFPRVDADTQRKRDDMRRQLLNEELQSEQRSLDAARRGVVLARQRAGTDPGPLMESVRLHEKNIEMLNRELARIK